MFIGRLALVSFATLASVYVSYSLGRLISSTDRQFRRPDLSRLNRLHPLQW